VGGNAHPLKEAMPKLNKTVLAVVADTHSGSSTGLLTPDRWVGMDGQTVHLSTGQRVLWQQWEECWERVRQLRKGARLVVIHNGDAVDGFHHDTTQVLTNNIEEQKRMHLAAMDWGLNKAGFKKKDKLYYVYGTETHVGQTEDAIARDLGAEPYIMPKAENSWRDGRFVHYHMKFRINGVQFDVAHHGLNSGYRAWTRENGIYNAVKSMYFSALEGGYDYPRYVIRSHMHQYLTADYQDRIRGFITPAFQLKTKYGHKVASMKLSSIGMLIFVIEADGRSYFEAPCVTYDEIGVIDL